MNERPYKERKFVLYPSTGRRDAGRWDSLICSCQKQELWQPPIHIPSGGPVGLNRSFSKMKPIPFRLPQRGPNGRAQNGDLQGEHQAAVPKDVHCGMSEASSCLAAWTNTRDGPEYAYACRKTDSLTVDLICMVTHVGAACSCKPLGGRDKAQGQGPKRTQSAAWRNATRAWVIHSSIHTFLNSEMPYYNSIQGPIGIHAQRAFVVIKQEPCFRRTKQVSRTSSRSHNVTKCI